MTEILIIETNLKKIISNYKKIYNFIFLYKEELINILEDNSTINSINDNIKNIEIDNSIKKSDKIVITIENINLSNYIDLYNYLHILKNILKDNITYINQIDIFEKKYLFRI
jgi:nitrate reductase NapAB chaperone NapD